MHTRRSRTLAAGLAARHHGRIEYRAPVFPWLDEFLWGRRRYVSSLNVDGKKPIGIYVRATHGLVGHRIKQLYWSIVSPPINSGRWFEWAKHNLDWALRWSRRFG